MRRLLASWWIVFLISLVAMLVLPSFGSIVDLQITKSFSDQDAIRTALDSFRVRNRVYPSADEGLNALVPNFAKRIPRDPWGNAYVYRTNDEGHYVLYSVGVNALDENGAGDDVTTSEKQYECSTYGVDCGPGGLMIGALVALTLFLASGMVGLLRGIRHLRKILAKHRGIEA